MTESPGIEASQRRLPEHHDQARHAANPHNLGETLTREEIEAVIAELMANPIEDLAGKRMYEIEPRSDGIVVVTRLPVGPEAWKGPRDEAVEGKADLEVTHRTPKRTLPRIDKWTKN